MCSTDNDMDQKRSKTKYSQSKLQSAQRTMKRQMLQVSPRDKIRRSAIGKQTTITYIIVETKQSMWRWAGHAAQRNDNRGTKRLNDSQGGEHKQRQAKKKMKKILQLSSVRHVRDKQKTEVLEEIMRRDTFNTGWT